MSNTKLNFKVALKNVEGQDTELTLAGELSKMLGMIQEGKTLKLYGWHKTLQVGDPLILDDADKKELISIIENDKNHFAFFKGQLLEVIDKAK